MKASEFFPALRQGIIRNLRGTKLHIWLTYYSHANRQDLAWPSRALVVSESGYSKRVVKAARKWLFKNGWLQLTGNRRGHVPVCKVTVGHGKGVTKGDPNENGKGATKGDPLGGTKGDPNRGHETLPQKSYREVIQGSQDADGNVHSPSAEEEAALRRVWDFYLQTFHKHPKLTTFTDLRKRLGLLRIRECMVKLGGDLGKAEQMLCAAIEERAASAFHMGKNDQKCRYVSWEKHLFATQEQMEGLLDP